MPSQGTVNEIDSLYNLLNQPGSDLLQRGHIYSVLCYKLCYSNSDTAYKFGWRAARIGMAENDNQLTGEALNRVGIVKDIISDWDSALYYYNKSLKYAVKAQDTTTLSGIYNNKGLIYWNKGNLDKAIKYFYKALKTIEPLKNYIMISSITNNISLVFYDQKQYERAYKMQWKALNLRRKIGDLYGIGASLTNIGMIHEDLGNIDSSIIYTHKSISLKKFIRDYYGLAKAYGDLGITYMSGSYIDSAKLYLNKSIGLHLKVGNIYNAASSYMNMGSVYSGNKQYKKALSYCDSALTLSRNKNYDKLNYKILASMGYCYSQLGQFEKAYYSLKEAKVMKDSIFQIESSKAIEEMQAKYQLEKKTNQINDLKRTENEHALLLANQELKIKRRNIYLGSLTSLFLISVMFIITLVTRRRAKENELKNKAIIAEREHGIKAIIEATEQERTRIAKDLHDGVSQQITALRMHLQNIRQKLSDEELNVLSRQVERTGNDIRNISHQMMPFSLQRFGLITAIEDMLQQNFSSGPIDASLEYSGFENRLPENIELTLFRICQELINNILKHANATKIDIQLVNRGDRVILFVEDNGVGFTLNEGKKGIGLLNIENRLKVYNGNFEIQKQEYGGTLATCRISLVNEKMEANE